MNTEDNRDVDELISNVLQDNVPADVDRRLHGQLDDFRSRLGELATPAARGSTTRRRRVWFGMSAAAATIAVAAVVGWTLWPSITLADVAAAVLKQPWIHVTEARSDRKTSEFWYSPTRDISAWRDSDWIEYRDHRLRIYYAYDLHEKVLYRVPEETRRGMEHLASTVSALRLLLEDSQPTDKPLERLGLFGQQRTQVKVVEQSIEKVEANGRKWLDYHLTLMFHEPKRPHPIQEQMLFRVDPETKLLHLDRYVSPATTVENRYEYPQKGPADIYDIGVPRTAQLINRVPNDDLARILETLRAGRQHMDNYRAALVQVPIVGRRGNLPYSLEILCRKGDKFRRDAALIMREKDLVDPKVKWQYNDKQAANWWNECVKDRYWFIPMSIDRGSTQYTTRWRSVTDPDGSHHTEITEVAKRESWGIPGETYPGLWSQMPELACRPPLGIPNETMEAVLEQDPKEGPAGTILLRVRSVGPKLPREKNSDGKLLLPPPDGWRFWLDPKRDYVVVRDDMLGDFDDTGKEKVITTVIDEMARSPQGTWYATRIRRIGASRDSKGKTYDQIIDIYVDFNADLPDSLFEPPKPGRIH